jgi:acetyltransferase-like isoleucine patch superfamily enzyme
MNFESHRSYKSHGDGRFKRQDFAEIGDNVVIEQGVLVFHPQNILLGSNIYIGHNTILHGYYKNDIRIGDDTWIGQGCFLHGAGGILIGRAVGLGPMVKILTSAHREGSLSEPLVFCELQFGRVIVEDGCDIGMGSVILPGVKIGEGSIIGAGSVVTGDVPSYSVFAGNPARFLRNRHGFESP